MNEIQSALLTPAETADLRPERPPACWRFGAVPTDIPSDLFAQAERFFIAAPM